MPDTVTAGQRVEIRFDVGNQGDASADRAWTDIVYISGNTELNEKDTVLETVSHTEPLASGKSYAYTASVTIPADSEGDYYIHVVTDTEDTIYEHTDENNNAVYKAVTVLPYPPVDLNVADFSILGSGSSGQALDISYTVENTEQGATLSSRWYDAVYFSPDSVLNPDNDTLLETFIHEGAVAYEQTYSADLSVTLPDGVSGDYYLIFKTDNKDSVSESNEDNNIRSVLISVELTPPPDLEITLAEMPTEAVAGQPVAVNWTVQNIGSAGTVVSSWYDSVFLSLDNVFDINDIRLKSFRHYGGLNIGENYSINDEVEIPIYASGMYYLLIKADSREDVYEHEAEHNNVVSQAVVITVPPPSDLVVTDITILRTAVPGEMVTVSWTVKNIGPNAAQGRMSEAVYVSENNEWEFTDPLLGIITRDINLGPGSSVRMSMKADPRKLFRADENGNITETLPGVVGEHYVAVRTDVKNNINESDDANNTLISNGVTDVGVPGLTADVATDMELERMQKKYFQIDVAEGLDLRITLTGDVEGASNEVYVAFDRMPTLTDHDYAGKIPFEAGQEVLVPSTQAGTYYVLVMARELPNGVGLENVSLLAEPMVFSIAGITPDRGGSGGRVTCTVSGAGFRDTTKVFLRGADDSMLEGKFVEFVNTMLMKVRWDLDGVDLGEYDVVAENADASTAEYSEKFIVENSTGMQVLITELSADVFRDGAVAPMTFQFKNTGNIDISYFKVSIFYTFICHSKNNSKYQ
ncbi:MAG: hypothetical protein GY749_32355 [Desulfobacteraceae bacterium]|nr:hypothetical protein [Desulfobacteraceae bacterium]